AVEPRGERGIAAEAGETAVRPDERVLGDLLGVGAVAQEREGDGEDLFAIAGHDFHERAFVTGVETTHEFGVVGGFLLGVRGTGAAFGRDAGLGGKGGSDHEGRGLGWLKHRFVVPLFYLSACQSRSGVANPPRTSDLDFQPETSRWPA